MADHKNNDVLKINLIEGTFTSSEAADLINEMVDVKLNFHKLHRIAVTEGNENESCEEDNDRIEELTKCKIENREYLKEAKKSNRKFRVTSVVHIEPIED